MQALTTAQESASSRLYEAPGLQVHYHDLGEGPPLLLIGSYGPRPGTTAWLMYHKILGTLAERYRCLVLDLPGWGRSSVESLAGEPGHHSIARSAVALLDHLGIDSLPVIGNSVGGTTGLVMSIEYPERVRRLVTGGCHASTGGDPYLLSPFPSEVLRLFAEAHDSAPDKALIARLMRALVFDNDLVTDELVQQMYDTRVVHPELEASLQTGTRVLHSNIGELHEIEAPTLIIHGRFDRMVPFEQALMLFSYIRSSDVHGLNNCGHWPPFERPGPYLAQVLRFLAEE